jgi:outer membrane receptor protein involved in Fe transport
VVEPLAWLRLRAQAGRAYRAPGFDELYHPDEGFLRGNPDLSPEDAWNVDGGVELELAQAGPLSNLRLRATGFYREIDDSIVWVLVDLRTIAPINTGSATTVGFEASASIDWTRYLRLSANHTYTDSERDATGESLSGVPEHETFARLRLGPEKVWKLVGEVHRVSEIQVNEGGSYRLPSRVVWNASASLNLSAVPFLPFDRFARELWIFAALDNIGDESVRDAVSFPQPGRNGRAGVEVRW